MSAESCAPGVALLLLGEVCVLTGNSRKLPLSPNLKTGDEYNTTCLRFYFSRKGSLIYIAHLDMLRLFERALIRSGLSYASSQGFNPRPLIVFALPVGIGVAVERDLIEITFIGEIDPEYAIIALNVSLPEDISIVSAAIAPVRSKSIMALVRRAEYVFISKDIAAIMRSALKSRELPVDKISGGRKQTIDIKPLIIDAASEGPDMLKVVFCAGSKNNLRPDLFLRSLRDFGLTEEAALDTKIIRTGIILEEEIQEDRK